MITVLLTDILIFIAPIFIAPIIITFFILLAPKHQYKDPSLMSRNELDKNFTDVFDYDLAFRVPDYYYTLNGQYKITAVILHVDKKRSMIIAAIDFNKEQVAAFTYNFKDIGFNLRSKDIISAYANFINITEYMTLNFERKEVPLLSCYKIILEGRINS